MKKINKKTGIIVLIIAGLFFIGIIIFSKVSGRTLKNPDGILGNTAGNLYNHGLFCEYNGKIYFSNPDDNGALYVMNSDCTNLQKVYDDKIRYINVDENYIYYARVNNLKTDSTLSLYSTGLFRINRSGNPHLKTLCKDSCATLLLYGNTIYYQKYAKSLGLSLYSIGIDGSSDKQLSEEGIIPGSIQNGSLIYSGINEDRNIKRLNLENMSEKTILETTAYLPIANGNGVYFIDVSTYHICFTNYTGEVKELVSKACSSYNISNDGLYLYYQTDRGKTNYIGVLNLKTGEDTLILEGDFKEINVTSKYVFFNDFKETETYAYSTDGSGTLSLFKPGK